MSTDRGEREQEKKKREKGEEDWQQKLINEVPSNQLPSLISDRRGLSQHVLRLHKQGRPDLLNFQPGCRRPGGGSSVSSLLEAEKTLDALKRKVLEQEREMNTLRAELDMFNSKASERRDVHETYMRMLAFLEDYGLSVDLNPDKLAVEVDGETSSVSGDDRETKEDPGPGSGQGDVLGFLSGVGEWRVRERETEDEVLVKEYLRRMNSSGEEDTPSGTQPRTGVRRVGNSNRYTLDDSTATGGRGEGPLFQPDRETRNRWVLGSGGQHPVRAEEFLSRLPTSVIRSSGSTLEDKHMRVVDVRASVARFLDECRDKGERPRRLDE